MKMDALNVQLCFSREDVISVGILSQIDRTSVFQFSPEFLSRGLPLSPFYLPLRSAVQPYDRQGGMETFGVFEDALPDSWGRRIIDHHFIRTRGRTPTLMERFACVGNGGMGALAFQPAEPAPAPDAVFDLNALAENAWDFDDNKIEDVLPELRRLAGSSGGARPKALVGFNPDTGTVVANNEALPEGFEHWIVKFNTRNEGVYAGSLEFAYNELAKASGADVPACRLIDTKAGRFFATRRFDRRRGSRLHLHSAAGLLHANFRIAGEEYATLFHLTAALTRDYMAKKELFRRVCLNVLAHNRDDHLKNFAFLMEATGDWRLSPLFDFTFSSGPNGWHTLSVAGEGERPTSKDLLKLAETVELEKADARDILEQVCSGMAELPRHGENAGVPKARMKAIIKTMGLPGLP
jgi:serine/threonine-protein kinase HipA